MNDLFNEALVKKEPHIVFNWPNAKIDDTATWQTKIKQKKSAHLRKLDEAKMEMVEKQTKNMGKKIDDLWNLTTYS